MKPIILNEQTLPGPIPDNFTHDRDYDQFLAGLQTTFQERVQRDTRLFIADVEQDLFDVFLNKLPSMQQHHNCRACRRFTNTYGTLVTVDEDGNLRSVVWDTTNVPEFYRPAVKALDEMVTRCPIRQMFFTTEPVWGQPETGPWRHMAVTPEDSHIFRPKSVLTTSFQVAAERTQDFVLLKRAVAKYPLVTIRQAMTMLRNGMLARPEKSQGVIEWIAALQLQLEDIKNHKIRDNLIWRAVATAPSGFCHLSNSVAGTLLDDLLDGKTTEAVIRNYNDKVDPEKYQRPQAAPAQGNLEAAEKLFEALGTAKSLERRLAKLEDLQTTWRPASADQTKATKPGLFGHLKTKDRKQLDRQEVISLFDLPTVTLTWEKFARTILPNAAKMEMFIPMRYQHGIAFTTALDPEAPPILQWDREEQRNPVAQYVFPQSVPAESWNLTPHAWCEVEALVTAPHTWFGEPAPNHAIYVAFILQDAMDTARVRGNGLFPETLKSEYRPYRDVIEAYSREAMMHGRGEPSAVGMVFYKHHPNFPDNRVRVIDGHGQAVTYRLDRWD